MRGSKGSFQGERTANVDVMGQERSRSIGEASVTGQSGDIEEGG